MILSFRTDRPGQTVQTQIRLLLEDSLIRVYTVCHSVCIVWTHYTMVQPHSSNFRVITTIFLGVPIFRTSNQWKIIFFKLLQPLFHQFLKKHHPHNRSFIQTLLNEMSLPKLHNDKQVAKVQLGLSLQLVRYRIEIVKTKSFTFISLILESDYGFIFLASKWYLPSTSSHASKHYSQAGNMSLRITYNVLSSPECLKSHYLNYPIK